MTATTDWTRTTGDPACWSWPVPAELDLSIPWAGLADWQGGRCALCGTTGRRLENDHDYGDGLRRGQLCPSCNVHEGTCGAADCACVGYRMRPPAVMLGVLVEHPGWSAIRVPEQADETTARTGKIRGRRTTL